MGIRRHNRTIWVLALLTFLLLMTFLVREGKLQSLVGSSSDDYGASQGQKVDVQELFGDKVSSVSPGAGINSQENRLKFSEVLNRLSQCFRYKLAPASGTPSVQIEVLIQNIQTEVGPVTQQSDRWTNWNIRTRDGQKRRLQLLITDSDEGKVGKELFYFSVGLDGELSPIPIAAEVSTNPTSEVINNMLKGGEVVSKERAAVAFFSNGDRIEYVERNNELLEIEMIQIDRQFRCADIRIPENCQCQ